MDERSKTAKPKNKGGRPLFQIDWNSFDNLCAIHCTLKEIAGFFGCSEDTIERAVQREKGMGFADYHDQKSGPGKVSLRRKQFDMAQKGDRVMLIWLGKQYLGQSEKVEERAEVVSRVTATVATATTNTDELKAMSTEQLSELYMSRLRK